mmetsp:Transcript_23329/g.88506  ORF Transcript_23329/g.88506 Transcript_23329/m.88506 type:complete len:223 (-) Transcript_23329:2010-2678(-)
MPAAPGAHSQAPHALGSTSAPLATPARAPYPGTLASKAGRARAPLTEEAAEGALGLGLALTLTRRHRPQRHQPRPRPRPRLAWNPLPLPPPPPFRFPPAPPRRPPCRPPRSQPRSPPWRNLRGTWHRPLPSGLPSRPAQPSCLRSRRARWTWQARSRSRPCWSRPRLGERGGPGPGPQCAAGKRPAPPRPWPPRSPPVPPRRTGCRQRLPRRPRSRPQPRLD